MSGDKEVRLQQRPRLQALYSDYSAPHHDVFVQKYNKELDAARTKMYEENRGINAQGNVAEPATVDLTAEGDGLPTRDEIRAAFKDTDSPRVIKLKSDIAETEALLNDPEYAGERENLQLHLDEQNKRLAELERGPADFTIAAQRPGMSKDDLKTVADVVQAFKDGKITYGKDARNQRAYSEEGTDYEKLDKALADIPSDSKISVAKDKVTITVKGEPLTEGQKAANAVEAKRLLTESESLLKEASVIDITIGGNKGKYDILAGKANRTREESVALLEAKSKDIKHVFYFEGDRLKQGQDAGGELVSVMKSRIGDKDTEEIRGRMKQMAAAFPAFKSDPTFVADGKGWVHYEGKNESGKPVKINLAEGLFTGATGKELKKGDTVRLSPGYLENKTDEVYLIPKDGEGKTFYSLDKDTRSGRLNKDAERIGKIKRGEYVPERLQQRYDEALHEGTLGAAADVVGGIQATVSGGEISGSDSWERHQRYKILAESEIRPAEAKALKEWAEDNNKLIPSSDFDQIHEERGAKGGQEHLVYFSEDGTRVFKANNLSFHETYLDFFHRLAVHNVEFPETAYTLEGFVEKNGKLMPVISQPAIKGRKATFEESHNNMIERGYEPIGTSDKPVSYRIPETDLIIRDVHGDNTRVKPTGEVFVIDPVIEHDLGTKADRLKGEAAAEDKSPNLSLSKLKKPGIKQADALAAVEPLLKTWKNAPPVDVLQSESGLPPISSTRYALSAPRGMFAGSSTRGMCT